MSQSYRKPYCGITAGGEKFGEKSDKQRANRNIRRVNKSKVAEAVHTEDNEPSKPYKGKKSIQVYSFRKDGKTAVDPKNGAECGFHFKKLAKGKVRMIK